MKGFRKSVYMTRREEETPSLGYCVTWAAQNLDNIKMSLDGTIDFTEELGARTINGGTSLGTVTSYIVNGVTYPASIPMTFTLKKANFSTNTLDAVTNDVLTVITFSVEIICNDASDITLSNITLSAMEVPDQFNSSYDSCS